MRKIRFSPVETRHGTSQRMMFSVLFLFTATLTFAQAPADYYSSAEGKKGHALRVAMHNIIKNHTKLSYNDLWDAYYTTDKRLDTNKLWDMYSDRPGARPAYYFSLGSDQCGNYGQEGDCYNREHSVPKSWFGTSTPPPPMYTDLFHLIPTDGYVNSKRDNLPLGKVIQASWTSTNGSKKGTSNIPGYSGDVFEPIDSFKGDFARIYFYMAVCYMDKNLGLETQSNFTGGDLKPWANSLLLQWAAMDPVSRKEIDRNNAVYQIQHNRNPFVDFPELAEMIFGSDTTTAFQVSIAEHQMASPWVIFPNPAKDIINIQSVGFEPDEANIEVLDLLGKPVLTMRTNGTERTIMDISSLAKGIYLLRISSERCVKTYKIVKQ